MWKEDGRDIARAFLLGQRATSSTMISTGWKLIDTMNRGQLKVTISL